MRKIFDIKLILRNIADSGKVFILLFDDAVVIVVILFVLRFLGIQIPVPFMIVGGIILTIFVLIIHIAVIPSFHKKQVTGREGMIGEKGKVVEPLTPIGTISFKGEYWRAESIDEKIMVGEVVEIIGVEGLTLKVMKIA